MDAIQELNERSIGDQFMEWYNAEHGTKFRFLTRPKIAPDLSYVDGDVKLHLEIAMSYYDEADAAFKWLNARGKPDAPSSVSCINGTDKLIANIVTVIGEKCLKSYGPDCILVISVIPPVTEAERLEARLGEITFPSRMPFKGIYLTGHFGVSSRSAGGFRCCLSTQWHEAQLLLGADGVRHARGTAEPAGVRTPRLNHAFGGQ
jgi:hypothetical protein